MDLRSLAGHFYDLAARVLELFEEEEIVDVLCEVRYTWHVEGHYLDEVMQKIFDEYCWADFQEKSGSDCGSCSQSTRCFRRRGRFSKRVG